MKPMALVGQKKPVLQQVASPVLIEELPRMADLASRMLATCRVKKGLAIAAPQVGVSKRLVVCWDGSVWINPRLVLDDEETTEEAEGCLSIPGRAFMVVRAVRCEITALSLGGEEVVADLEDLEARMWQHEVDHLDGVLISSRGREVANLGPSQLRM